MGCEEAAGTGSRAKAKGIGPASQSEKSTARDKETQTPITGEAGQFFLQALASNRSGRSIVHSHPGLLREFRLSPYKRDTKSRIQQRRSQEAVRARRSRRRCTGRIERPAVLQSRAHLPSRASKRHLLTEDQPNTRCPYHS